MYSYISKDGSLMVAGETLIMYSGAAEHVEIPQYAEPGHPIRAIGDGAFHKCQSMKSLVLPSGVTSIGDSTFGGCKSLKSVRLPHGLTSIGSNAFEACSSLNSIMIPSGVTFIGAMAFFMCSSLNSITLPAGVTNIGNRAFSGCGALRITISCTEQEFSSLLHHSRKNSTGARVVLQPKTIPAVQQLAEQIGNAPAAVVPENIPILFSDPQDPCESARRSVYKAYMASEIQCFGQNTGSVTEDEAFHRLTAARSRFGAENPEAETQSDWYLRAEKQPPFCKTCCITFREEQVAHKNGTVNIRFKFQNSWWFWQSAQSISWNGRQYWLYSRNYLTADGKIPFYRLDMAIYSSDGLVTDRKLSEEIYAKYKLAAIL